MGAHGRGVFGASLKQRTCRICAWSLDLATFFLRFGKRYQASLPNLLGRVFHLLAHVLKVKNGRCAGQGMLPSLVKIHFSLRTHL